MTTRKGCRPLSDEEIDILKDKFDTLIANDTKDLKLRDYTLIMLPFYIGTRISETLSIKVKDVFQFGRVTDSVYLKRENTKGKRAGRTGIINDQCKELLTNYIKHYGLENRPDDFLFFSKKGHLRRSQATKIISNIFKEEMELDGKVSTHTCRKTFAKKAYTQLNGSLPDLKECLGHSNINSTLSYISHNNEKINNFLENLSY